MAWFLTGSGRLCCEPRGGARFPPWSSQQVRAPCATCASTSSRSRSSRCPPSHNPRPQPSNASTTGSASDSSRTHHMGHTHGAHPHSIASARISTPSGVGSTKHTSFAWQLPSALASVGLSIAHGPQRAWRLEGRRRDHRQSANAHVAGWFNTKGIFVGIKHVVWVCFNLD